MPLAADVRKVPEGAAMVLSYRLSTYQDLLKYALNAPTASFRLPVLANF